MDNLTPELKVAEAGEKYFRTFRESARDPRVSMAAAKWEIFFGDQTKELKKKEAEQLQLTDLIGDHDQPLKRAHK